MIEYKDIPKYCDSVDKNKSSTVLLSKYQFWLFKKLMPNNLKKLPKFLLYFDIAVYFIWLILIMVSARHLLLLGYFRYRNCSMDSLEFHETSSGKIALTFNPGALPNNFY